MERLKNREEYSTEREIKEIIRGAVGIAGTIVERVYPLNVVRDLRREVSARALKRVIRYKRGLRLKHG